MKNGLKKFSEENIEIKSFFAPNHTYDINTFAALKNSGINEIIDGYGLMPYVEYEIKFIPQLFYKLYMLPFGIQATQIHLNYWKQNDFNNFEEFVKSNQKKIIDYEQALKKVNNSIGYRLINKLNTLDDISYQAINVNGDIVSNLSEQNVNAVTWGVFPGQEILQPTIVDARSFLIWKDEAFGLWINDWASIYNEKSDSYNLLHQIHDSYYLVNIVDNNFINGDMIKHILS